MSRNKSTERDSPRSYGYDLQELIAILWMGKWTIFTTVLVTTVLAVGIALLLPNVYRAEALLAPNQRETPGTLASLASQYSNITSLAGIDLGASSTDKTDFGLEVLQSRKFITKFIDRRNILVPLVARGSYDSTSGEFNIDADDYDVERGKWTRRVGPPKTKKPSALEAYRRFMEILSIRQDRDSGFITVGVEHQSPVLAKEWAEWLVHDVNEAVMQQDMAEANQAIEYLNEQIGLTSVAELKAIFFRLIEDQTKTIMLAKISPEYLFKTIDPAVVPEEKVRPRRLAIATIGFVTGLFISLLLTQLLHKFSRL